MRRVKKGKSLKDNREIPNITICRDRFPITVAIIEQPVLCPYTFYIIAVAVAIGRELTHPTNVANLHAVIGAACLIDVHSFCSLVVCRSGTQDAT